MSGALENHSLVIIKHYDGWQVAIGQPIPELNVLTEEVVA
jgi:hypothetical protein